MMHGNKSTEAHRWARALYLYNLDCIVNNEDNKNSNNANTLVTASRKSNPGKTQLSAGQQQPQQQQPNNPLNPNGTAGSNNNNNNNNNNNQQSVFRVETEQVNKWETQVSAALQEKLSKLNALLKPKDNSGNAPSPIRFEALSIAYTPAVVEVSDYENSIRRHQENVSYINNAPNDCVSDGVSVQQNDNTNGHSNALQPITSFDCSDNIVMSRMAGRRGRGGGGGKRERGGGGKRGGGGGGGGGGKRHNQHRNRHHGGDGGDENNQNSASDEDADDAGVGDFVAPATLLLAPGDRGKFGGEANQRQEHQHHGKGGKKQRKGFFSKFNFRRKKHGDDQGGEGGKARGGGGGDSASSSSSSSSVIVLSSTTAPRLTSALCVYQLHRARLFNQYMKIIDQESEDVAKIMKKVASAADTAKEEEGGVGEHGDHGGSHNKRGSVNESREAAERRRFERSFRKRGTLKGNNFFSFYLSQQVQAATAEAATNNRAADGGADNNNDNAGRGGRLRRRGGGGGGGFGEDWSSWYYHDYETFLALPIFANISIKEETIEGEEAAEAKAKGEAEPTAGAAPPPRVRKTIQYTTNYNKSVGTYFRITNVTVLSIEDNKESLIRAENKAGSDPLHQQQQQAGAGAGAAAATGGTQGKDADGKRHVYVTCKFTLEGIRAMHVHDVPATPFHMRGNNHNNHHAGGPTNADKEGAAAAAAATATGGAPNSSSTNPAAAATATPEASNTGAASHNASTAAAAAADASAAVPTKEVVSLQAIVPCLTVRLHVTIDNVSAASAVAGGGADAGKGGAEETKAETKGGRRAIDWDVDCLIDYLTRVADLRVNTDAGEGGGVRAGSALARAHRSSSAGGGSAAEAAEAALLASVPPGAIEDVSLLISGAAREVLGIGL